MMITSCVLIFLFSVFVTSTARRYALQYSMLDIPNDRSSHVIPTPRGGGIAIASSFVLVSAYLSLSHTLAANIICALNGGLIIAVMGLCDDMYGLKNRWRLAGQILAAIWAVYWLGGFHTLDLGTWKISLGFRGSLLAVIGIVWLINLYNFMDGIDGLASSQGIFTSLAAAIALWVLQFPNYAFVMFLLAAAITGFALFNFPPAKIFLGDVGSGFLGYIFAVFGIATTNNASLPITFWIIILAVFICDATFTLISRAWNGKRWYAAHREHAYQHLNIYGATHKQISMTILFINIFVMLPVAFAALNWPQLAFWFLSGIIISLLCAWLLIKRLPIVS